MDKAIREHLVRPINFGCALPSQTVADGIGWAADHVVVARVRHSVGLREVRIDALKLVLLSP
jgi:hypothetical protein